MDIADRNIQYYSENAGIFYKKYDGLQFEEINSPWIHLVSSHRLKVLDIGAGSGRDAIWLANKGHEVMAVEPADKLRALAEKKHSHHLIHWVKDSLPSLRLVTKMGIKFDLILLNAVWMHIDPIARENAFETVVKLMNKRSNCVMTLRYGPSPDKRIMYPVCKRELIRLAEKNKINVVLDIIRDDVFGRSDVSWRTIVFHMPN